MTDAFAFGDDALFFRLLLAGFFSSFFASFFCSFFGSFFSSFLSLTLGFAPDVS